MGRNISGNSDRNRSGNCNGNRSGISDRNRNGNSDRNRSGTVTGTQVGTVTETQVGTVTGTQVEQWQEHKWEQGQEHKWEQGQEHKWIQLEFAVKCMFWTCSKDFLKSNNITSDWYLLLRLVKIWFSKIRNCCRHDFDRRKPNWEVLIDVEVKLMILS